MTGQPATLLAFDFGRRRIGVAVGQTITGTATPVDTLPSRDTRPDWVAIGRLVREWQPDALVVGLPLTLSGTDQDTTRAARRFGRQLGGRFGLPVHLVDERLSTREAHTRLAGGARVGDDDSVAAQVILEDWLNHRGPCP